MKTILRSEPGQQWFYPAYNGKTNIILEDPSQAASTGDTVDFQTGEFFDDTLVIGAFRKMTGGQLLLAECLNTRYTKDVAEIVVVLYREVIFREQFPHLSAQLAG